MKNYFYHAKTILCFFIFFLVYKNLFSYTFFDFPIYSESDTVDYKIVVIGDSNTSGKYNIANFLNSIDKVAVYNESKEGRSTIVIKKLLENNQNLIKAIQNSTHTIVYAGGNSPEHAKNGGLKSIFQRIKEINPNIFLIVFDIQKTEKEKLIEKRLEVNQTISELEDLIDYHFETNLEIADIEYLKDKIHLSGASKIKYTNILALDVFGLKIVENFENLNIAYSEKNIDKYIKIPLSNLQNISQLYKSCFLIPEVKTDSSKITIKKQSDEYEEIEEISIYNPINEKFEKYYSKISSEYQDFIDIIISDNQFEKCKLHKIFLNQKWENIYIPSNYDYPENYIEYYNDLSKNDILLFPKFQNPLENIDTTYKMSISSFNIMISEMNIPADSCEFVYKTVNQWEAYINSLSLEEQIKWIYWKKIFSNIVSYRTNPYKITIPEKLINYTDTVSYTVFYEDSLGSLIQKTKYQKLTISALPDAVIMYSLLYSGFEIEKQFPEYPSYLLNLVKLSIANLETKQTYGIETHNGVISQKGELNSDDSGGMQINFNTADYYYGLNPDFYNQFFYLDKSKRNLIFYDWISEQMACSYLVVKSKIKNGLSSEIDFSQIALKSSNWHKSNLNRKSKYVQSLEKSLILYDEYFSQFSKINIDNEVINEAIRRNFQYNKKTSFLDINDFQKVEKIIIDNKNILSEKYPEELAKELQNQLVNTYKYDENNLISNKIPTEFNNSLDENTQTDFQVDKDGHITYFLKKDETLYQLGQNRIRKWINYNNTVNNEYQKGEKYILCAEKNDDIVILNEKLKYEQLPEKIKTKYTSQLFDSISKTIEYEYFIFSEFQELEYQLFVRKGDANLLQKELNFLKTKYENSQITAYQYSTKIQEIKNEYELIQKEDIFFIPPSELIFSKENNSFLVLNQYIEALKTFHIIEIENNTSKMVVSELVKKQNEKK